MDSSAGAHTGAVSAPFGGMAGATAYIAYPLEYDYFRICEQYLAGQITMEDALGEMVQKYHLAENE